MKLKWFGVNVGHDPVYDPVIIGSAGFNSIRIVGQRHVYLPPYIDQCHRTGVSVAMVLTYGESMALLEQNRRMTAQEAAEYYANTYVKREDGRNVDVWLIGNESNGHHGSNPESSVMSPEEWNDWAWYFVQAIRAKWDDAPIYAVGTVTGDPDRVAEYRFHGFTGMDNHAYAQWPESVGGMLHNYDRYDAQYDFTGRILSEIGWPHSDPARRGTYIRDMVRVLEGWESEFGVFCEGVWVYCWELRQHWQPFAVGTKDGVPLLEAWGPIKELGYSPAAPVMPDDGIDWSRIGPGFKRWIQLEPGIVGLPAEGEEHGAPGAISSLGTTKGQLFWIGQRARKPEYGSDIDAVLFFKDSTTQEFYRFKENWERSEKLW